MNSRSVVTGLIWIIGGLISISGCARTADVVLPTTDSSVVGDTLAAPVEIEHNLSALNTQSMEGRATATRGLARAAVYLSRRLEGYGVQPAISPRYRQLYPMLSRKLESLSMVALGVDTLRFQPGIDFYAHSRSGSGSVRISSVFFDPTDNDDIDSNTLFLTNIPTEKALDSLRTRGVNAIVINARPEPSLFSSRLPAPEWQHIPIVLIPFATLERRGVMSRQRTLAYNLNLTVEVGETVVSSGINVLGVLPGMHPTGRNRAVVVVARFDGYGRMGQVVKTDGTDRAMGAVTLLEVARLLSAFRARGMVLDETVIFLFASGSMNENVGLDFFLNHPVWSESSIDQIIYLNDVGEDPGGVRQLFRGSAFASRALLGDPIDDDERTLGEFISLSERYNEKVFRRDAQIVSSRAVSMVKQIQEMTHIGR